MSAKLAVRAPYDGAPLGELPLTDERRLERYLAEAASLHERRAWLSKGERLRILERARVLVLERAEELAQLAASEGGKPLGDSRVELARAAEGIFAAAAHLFTLGGREVPMQLGSGTANRFAHTYYEPRGVSLGFSAFNHPFNLIVHQVIPAVAAGAPVVIKPASSTPLSCFALVDILREAGLPEEWVRPVVLERVVAERVVRDRRLAFFSFIGSADVGFRLQRRLADGVPAALEHGGVAPVVVEETADLDEAARLLVKGAFYHAGQVCVSVQRIYVARARVADFAERLASSANALRVGDPLDASTEVGPLIRSDEVQRVEDWVHAAVCAGARLAAGGRRLGPSTYAPTVLVDPPDDALVSTKEIFGPVAAVYGYDDLDEAVRRANAPDGYFQAAVFTRDLDRALDLGRRLSGTTVMVNDHTAFRADWMPFGGRGRSGLGMGGIADSVHDNLIERMIVFRSPSL